MTRRVSRFITAWETRPLDIGDPLLNAKWNRNGSVDRRAVTVYARRGRAFDEKSCWRSFSVLLFSSLIVPSPLLISFHFSLHPPFPFRFILSAPLWFVNCERLCKFIFFTNTIILLAASINYAYLLGVYSWLTVKVLKK